jgi:putative ABC transport system substrate-binding protein
VIVGNTPSALAAKAATTAVPIVFVTGGDPVSVGLVASLNRPAGNVTGISFITAELGSKQLGLLRRNGPFGIGEHGNARGSRPQLTR